MKRIPQQTIDQIIETIDIVDLVQEYVPLTKAGANFKACCPFHQEKTPSFNVSSEKQIYHCFGCGVGGNALKFVMEMEKSDFLTAIRKLADRTGIDLPKSEQEKPDSERQMLYRVNAYVQWFFRQTLLKSNVAKKYLQGRNIHDNTAELFGIGYAPDSFDDLVRFLESKSVPTALTEKLGLVRRRQSGSGFYAFFRNRITFPIRDAKGNIIGFGGRALAKDQQAKYINSPESPIYHKGKEIYGLFENKKSIIATGRVIITEGYVDTIACHQLGFEQAVAPLGTSLTKDQLSRLKRYTKRCYLLFDGDNAGKSAAQRAIQIAFDAGIHPHIITLGDGQDPGDFLGKEPKEAQKALQNLIETAPTAMDWLFNQALDQIGSDPAGRAKALGQLSDWTAKLPDKMERITYRNRLADFFNLDPRQIQKTVEVTDNYDTFSSGSALNKEEQLVVLFARYPDQFKNKSLKDFAQGFKNKALLRLSEEIEKDLKNHETFDAATAIGRLSEDTQALASHVFMRANNDLKAEDVTFWIKKYEDHNQAKKLQTLTAEIAQAESKKDYEKAGFLLKQKQELLKEIALANEEKNDL
ncbi:MAG: DNA primase [Deltaproteobacteria bacterium]|nr:DNA primase [Deltaproteobacteria bacterium]